MIFKKFMKFLKLFEKGLLREGEESTSEYFFRDIL